MRISIIGALVGGAVVIGACGGGAAPSASSATTVNATLTDKAIALSAPSVSAGSVTFHVVNSGTVIHNLLLLKTDVAQDKLPADPKDASKVQETGSVASTGQIAAGQSKDFTRDLAPGNYVVICNEPAHYLVGMHIAFVVK